MFISIGKQHGSSWYKCATIVLLLVCMALAALAFAFPKASFAEEGNEFDCNGFIYEVVGEGKVELVGWQEDPQLESPSEDAYELRSPVSTFKDSLYTEYEVVGVKEGALTGFDKTMVLTSGSAALIDDALSSKSGLSEDVDLTLKMESLFTSSVDIKSSSSFVIVDDDSNSQTVTLPEGYSIDSYSVSGAGVLFKNSTSSTISFTYKGLSGDKDYPVSPGDTFDTSWFSPYLDTISCSINGGSAQLFSVDDSIQVNVTLPEGTPLDATIDIDLSPTPGIAKGYVTTSWENNRSSVTLHNGSASASVDLTSANALPFPYPVTLTFSVAESAGKPSVWIAGTRYDDGFEADGMKLSYDEQGVPTLTLDGADIDIFSNTDVDSAISCSGDLNIVLENSDSRIEVGGTQKAIEVGGKLTVTSSGTSSSSNAALNVAYGNASEMTNKIVDMIYADSMQINAPIDVVCVDQGSGTGSVVTAFSSKGDVVIGPGSKISVGVNNKYRSDIPAPSAVYYGVVSDNGSISIQDATVAFDGYLSSSLISWNRDVSVNGQSSLTVDNWNTAQFGTIFAPYGIANVNVTGNGSVDISASRPEGGDPTLLDPSTIIAFDIVLGSSENQNTIVEPEGGSIGVTGYFEEAYGKLKTVVSPSDNTVPSPSVLIVSDDQNESFSGKQMSNLFSDSLGKVLWSNVLEKDGDYDPSYSLTARDGLMLSTCTLLDCTGIPASDFPSSRIDKLSALKDLVIELPDTGDAVLSLPASLKLDTLDVYTASPQSIVLKGAHATKLSFYVEGESSATKSIEIGDDVSYQYLDVDGLDGLETLSLPEQLATEGLSVTSCRALQSISLPEGYEVKDLTVKDCPALTALDLSSNTALENLCVNNTKLSKVIVPDGAALRLLDVSNNDISELVVPDSSKDTLGTIKVYNNALASLDLSSFSKLTECGLADPNDESKSQEASFVGQEQADKSVVVDLSSIAAGIVNLKSNTGTYDAEKHTITFADSEAAKQGFSYEYNTGAVLATERSGSLTMPVAASVSVEPYDPSHQGGSGSGGPEGQVGPSVSNPNGNDGPDLGNKENGENKDNDGLSLPTTSDDKGMFALVAGIVALIAVIGIVVSLVVRSRSRK